MLTHTLTAEDVKALRRAETVVVSTRDGRTYLRAGIGVHNVDGPARVSTTDHRLFPDHRYTSDDGTRTERSRAIDLPDARLTTFDGQAERSFTASHVILSARFVDEWRTVADLARAGDEIRVQWVANDSSDGMRRAGIVRDELRLTLARGDKRLTFLVGVYVGPPNTARMVLTY